MDKEDKKMVGIILVSISGAFYLLFFLVTLNLGVLIFGFLGFMGFASIGLKLIYQTLTNKYKGLLIFLLGAILLTFTLLFTAFMITSMAGFRADLLSVILLSETLFFILASFIPGLYKFFKEVTLEGRNIYMYAIAPLAVFDMSIYSIIIAAVAPSTFLPIYFEFISMPLIFSVISSIIIVLVVYYY